MGIDDLFEVGKTFILGVCSFDELNTVRVFLLDVCVCDGVRCIPATESGTYGRSGLLEGAMSLCCGGIAWEQEKHHESRRATANRWVQSSGRLLCGSGSAFRSGRRFWPAESYRLGQGAAHAALPYIPGVLIRHSPMDWNGQTSYEDN